MHNFINSNLLLITLFGFAQVIKQEHLLQKIKLKAAGSAFNPAAYLN